MDDKLENEDDPFEGSAIEMNGQEMLIIPPLITFCNAFIPELEERRLSSW